MEGAVAKAGQKKGNGLSALGLNMKLNVLALPLSDMILGRALKTLCLGLCNGNNSAYLRAWDLLKVLGTWAS